MCEAVATLANGQQIACRKCKLCRQNRVKDWAGRNIAQSKTVLASFAGDLTYGPELDHNGVPIPDRKDHIRAAVLTYSDVQKFFKLLRYYGYEFRYFITGENGSLKGRAHWHFIIHFINKVPEHIIGKNFSDRHKNENGELFDFEVCKCWPHGFMYWKKAKYEDVFYNCKYILKDEDDENSQRKPGLSKKPPLGTEYFEKVAEQAVAQGIAPQSLEYRFPEIKKKKTKEPVLFYLQGRSAEMYLDHFIKTWAEQRGDQPRPKSDLVDLYEQYGQIVHDENALLIRRGFPKGESRKQFPSGTEIKALAKEAEAEREQYRREEAAAAKDNWRYQWVREAKNEQERQERQRLVDSDQQFEARGELQRRQDWFDQQARKGLVYDSASGQWVKSDPNSQSQRGAYSGRPRPGAGVQRPRVAGPDNGGLGRVGKWNKHYGKTGSGD